MWPQLSQLGRLNMKYHIEQRLSHLLATRGSALVGGVLGAGALVLGALASTLAVIVLVVYFLAGMPRIKLFAYRLAPHSRRARVILIGDEIFTKVGGFVLGNVVTSVIAGLGTYLWMLAFGIPYPIPATLVKLGLAYVALKLAERIELKTRFSSVPILAMIDAYLLLACISNVLTCFGSTAPTWFHRFFPLA